MVRVRAPELRGSGGWIGVDAPLTLRGLRGRIVVLHLWTLGCINCIHAGRMLAPLERRHADVLTVIGVHSPKFAREREHGAVLDAVARLGVTHPVLDDPEMLTWDAYAATAWPTLVVIDAEGRVAATLRGEEAVPRVRDLVPELVAEAEAAGTLRRGPGPAPGGGVAPAPPGPLRYPAGVLRASLPLPGGPADVLVVSDTGHHRLVAAEPGGRVRAVAGDGLRGPRGLAVLGGRVVVADAGAHTVLLADLAAGTATTIAGTGAQGHTRLRAGDARVPLRSPWDVAVLPGGTVAVAMAGEHGLWEVDPVTGAMRPLAGTGHENLRDGPADEALLAQPSGLAADGGRLWFCDAESSAVRVLERGWVRTLVGTGLWSSGFRDGPFADALLQHPSALAVAGDGTLLVADTYNDRLRRVDPAAGRVDTALDGLHSPEGVAVDADGVVWIADTGAHRVLRWDGRSDPRVVAFPGPAPPEA